jgi:flagellar biosynthesis/type III secretory pathway chaperone
MTARPDPQAIHEAEQLLALLRREHAALVAKDVDAILAISTEKSAALRQFETTLARWQDAQGRIAVPAAGDAGHAAWETLRALAEQCRCQNDINGGLIAVSLRYAQNALSVLRGAPEPATYSVNGYRQTSAPDGRSLAKA